MKTLAALILIICVGCRATDPITGKKKTASRAMVTVPLLVKTREQLTYDVDSIHQIIAEIRSHMVDLPADQWVKDSTGVLRQRGIFIVDSLMVTKGWVFVGNPKDSIPSTDTTHGTPHNPHDTIPVVNKKL